MNGLKDDLAGMNDPTEEVPVDDGWAEQYAGQEEAGEDEAQLAGQTIPFFSYYFVKGLPNPKAGYTKKKGSPVIRPGLQIVNGPEGTLEESVFDDLYLKINRNDQQGERKSDEDFQKQVKANQKKLNKIARVGRFTQAFPLDSSKTALETYAKQFEGFYGIVEIRERTEEYEGRSITKNRVVWESLRATDDPPTKKGLKKGYKTAEEEALAEIAAANQIAAKQAGKGDGRTAGSVSKRGSLRD